MMVREGKQIEVIDLDIPVGRTKETSNAMDKEAKAKEVKEMMRYLEDILQCVQDFPSKRPIMLQSCGHAKGICA